MDGSSLAEESSFTGCSCCTEASCVLQDPSFTEDPSAATEPSFAEEFSLLEDCSLEESSVAGGPSLLGAPSDSSLPGSLEESSLEEGAPCTGSGSPTTSSPFPFTSQTKTEVLAILGTGRCGRSAVSAFYSAWLLHGSKTVCCCLVLCSAKPTPVQVPLAQTHRVLVFCGRTFQT